MKRIVDLRSKANVGSERYSNADFTKILEQQIEGWRPSKPRVTTSAKCATVNMTMEGASSRIRFQLFLDVDFRAACKNLADHLSCYSYPIDEIFPRFSHNPGEIRLETDIEASTPAILWVYYNVFVVAELQSSECKEPMATPEAQSSKAFYLAMDKLFRHIRDGCVATREEVSQPTVSEIKTTSAHIGQNFVVEMTVDRQCFHNIVCEDHVSRISYLFSTPQRMMWFLEP